MTSQHVMQSRAQLDPPPSATSNVGQEGKERERV